MTRSTGIRKVLLVGTYPPNRCGIASFTADLRDSLLAHGSSVACGVVAIDPTGDVSALAAGASMVVRPTERADYQAAASLINTEAPDVLCIQHEFGIFGGNEGNNVLALFDGVECPIATVLHTVLDRFNDQQEAVFIRILARSEVLIVMSESARDLLVTKWGVDSQQIWIIPHGAPDPTSGSEPRETPHEWDGRPILLSFGLLSPDKGVDVAIRAMPHIVTHYPDALYVIVGVTHPNLLAHEGERY